MCHRDCSLGELDYLILVSQGFFWKNNKNITVLMQNIVQNTFSMQLFNLQNELSVSVDVDK